MQYTNRRKHKEEEDWMSGAEGCCGEKRENLEKKKKVLNEVNLKSASESEEPEVVQASIDLQLCERVFFSFRADRSAFSWTFSFF